MRRRNSPRRRRGFTLMEVLLVLAILVILGSMLSIYIVSAQKSSFEDAARIQISGFKTQLESYRLHVGSFPSSSQGLQALRTPPSDLKNPAKWRGPYADGEIPLDPWDNPYKYELLNADQYRITSFGADGVEGTEDDILSDA